MLYGALTSDVASYTGGKDWIILNLKNLPHLQSTHQDPRGSSSILASTAAVLDPMMLVHAPADTVLRLGAHLFPVFCAPLHSRSHVIASGTSFAGPHPFTKRSNLLPEDKPDY